MRAVKPRVRAGVPHVRANIPHVRANIPHVRADIPRVRAVNPHVRAGDPHVRVGDPRARAPGSAYIEDLRVLAHGSLLIAFALFSRAAWAVPPITPSDIAPAAFQQTAPEVASNGRGVVAVWWDQRMTARFDHHPAIFATRLDENGRPLDPLGIESPVRLAETEHPSHLMNTAAAWDGKLWLPPTAILR